MTTRREVRPAIGAAIQREVRQRCAFGCVICGTPIFEYHHMTPWAEVREHTAENLTLLCDLHHKEATGVQPLLTEAQIRRLNYRPYNSQVGASTPHILHFEGPDCEVIMGSNFMVASGFADFIAAAVDGHPLLGFRFDEGLYMLHFRYYTPDNLLVLTIVDNEISYSADLWDVHWTANRLTIREKLREVVLDIEFRPPNRVIIHRGKMHWNGVTIKINNEYLDNGIGQRIQGSVFECNVGLHVGHDQRHLIMQAGVFNRSPTRLPGFECAEQASCPLCFPW